MLSDGRVKELLGSQRDRCSEEAIEELTVSLYALARQVLEQDRTAHSAEESALTALSTEDRESVEERAAVLEFDARMPRDKATRAAMQSFLRHQRSVHSVVQ